MGSGCSFLSRLLGLLNRNGVLSETVLESPRNMLEVAHTAGTGGLSPLSLLTPLI